MKTPIKAVLFDLDDTLWPIDPVIQQAELTLHDWLAIHAPEVARCFSIDALRQRRAALMQAHPRYKIDLWALRHATLTEAFRHLELDLSKVDQAMAIFADARNAVTPFDDVAPGLVQLRQRVVVGSISNGFADLQAIGLAHHFQVSIAAHTFGRAKPDPLIFHSACEALGVAPSEAVYVGDDLMLDVDGAQKAGLRGVWMNRFGRDLPGHVRPDAVCVTLHELDHWLAMSA